MCGDAKMQQVRVFAASCPPAAIRPPRDSYEFDLRRSTSASQFEYIV